MADTRERNRNNRLRPIQARTARQSGQAALRTPQRKRLRRMRWILPALILIAAAGVLLYRYFAQFESTDDAQIDGYIYPVSSRVTRICDSRYRRR